MSDTKDNVINAGIASYFLSTCATAYYVDLIAGTAQILQDNGLNPDFPIEKIQQFYGSVYHYVEDCVHPDDKEIVRKNLDPQYIRETLQAAESYSFEYRDIDPAGAGMYRSVIMRGEDEDHIVLLYLNVTEEFRRELDREKMETAHRVLQENNARILALEDDFEALYDVDLESTGYEVYVKSQIFGDSIDAKMINENSFFEDTRQNIKRVVYPEDRESVARVLTAEYIRQALKENSHFDWYYRLLVNGDPSWKRMRILYKNADKKNIIVGVFNAEEEVSARQKDERMRYEIFNRMLGDDGLFLIDCVNNKRQTIHDHLYGAVKYSDEEPYSEAFSRYVNNCIAEPDRDLMREVASPAYMLKRTKSDNEYTVEYRDTTTGIQRFYEMRIAKFSDTEVLQSFSEKDTEIVNRLMFNRLKDDFYVLFGIDLDAGQLRIMKNVSPYPGKEGITRSYTDAMMDIASSYDGETKAFFERISNVGFLRQRFAKEDKAAFVYRSKLVEGSQWVSVTELVLSRHEDGTPSLLAMGFGLLDEEASAVQEIQTKIKEYAQTVSGLASEYTALYHVNFKTGLYKNYHITDRISDTKVNLGRFPRSADLFHNFVDSDAVHPDYREKLHEFCRDEDTVRASLKGIKRKSILFKRKYGDEYLWTEMIVIKCEDASEEAQNIIVGFIEKDAEVKREMESEQCRREADEAGKLIDSIASVYNIVYIVDMSDDSLEVRRMDEHMIEYGQNFADFSQAKEYTLANVIHPRDQERIRKEFSFDTIRRRLAAEPSYYVEYCIIKDGATLWCDTNITSVGGSKIIIGMAEKDTELARRHLEEKQYDEYFALYLVDVDTEIIREIKNKLRSDANGMKMVSHYTEGIREFASTLTGKTKDFFMQLSDLDYVRKELATEDKRTYTYQPCDTGDWVDVTSFVIQRHEDGTPAIFSLGFSPVDSLGARRRNAVIAGADPEHPTA